MEKSRERLSAMTGVSKVSIPIDKENFSKCIETELNLIALKVAKFSDNFVDNEFYIRKTN